MHGRLGREGKICICGDAAASRCSTLAEIGLVERIEESLASVGQASGIALRNGTRHLQTGRTVVVGWQIGRPGELATCSADA